MNRYTLLLLFAFILNVEISYADSLCIKKDLLYTNYTLKDQYPYNNGERCFQWNKMDSALQKLKTFELENIVMGTIHNYKNQHGIAPLVEPNIQNNYHNSCDTFGVERTQSVPLYSTDSLPKLTRYGRDGSLTAILGDTADYYKVRFMTIGGVWLIPKKYVTVIGPVFFKKVIFVDRKNQNIATLQQVDSCWLVRSMNPATTGLTHPPFQKPTPLGVFVIQEQKPRMIYYKDGTSIEAGFAPYASRFCCGGYIHGVPVNYPRTDMIEYSPTLGTTPRSHMCVRNATSHALFIYNWAKPDDTLVIVID